MSFSRLFFSYIFVVIVSFNSFSQTDSTAKPIQFATSTTITNNGISVIPIFTLGKPAAIINFTIGRKLTFEPEFRLSLEGKPWSFLYWFRYKLVRTKKFSMNIGAHPSVVFKTVPVTIDGVSKDMLRAQRFVAAEMAQNYRFTPHFQMGIYYLVAAASIENGTKPTNLLSLRGGYQNISLGKGFIGGIQSQVLYLATNGESGTYANATLSFTHKKSPVTFSYFYNQPIQSSITGGQTGLWNVSATYQFSQFFRPSK